MPFQIPNIRKAIPNTKYAITNTKYTTCTYEVG